MEILLIAVGKLILKGYHHWEAVLRTGNYARADVKTIAVLGLKR